MKIAMLQSVGAHSNVNEASRAGPDSALRSHRGESILCEASLPNVSYLPFPTWQTVTIGLAVPGASQTSQDNRTMSADEREADIAE